MRPAMALPRLQLFEFNDAAWAPAALRETVVESLSTALRWGRMLDGLVEPFAAFLERTGSIEVLDLCAGAGGPAEVLAEAMERRGRATHFLLSDLFPHVEDWEALQAANPARLGFVREPLDATNIPPGVGAGRARVIINALHHFPPALARAVLHGACKDAPGVFIAEGLVRNPLSFAAMAPVGIAALYASPAMARSHRLGRALFTWLTPIALAVSAWDGTVSSFRCYTEAELRDFVRDVDGFTWEYGEYSHSRFGRGSWFAGVRAR